MWEKIIEIVKELIFGFVWIVKNFKEYLFCLSFLLDLVLICFLFNEKKCCVFE